ncbi:hypothetical protein M378DRAFT_174139, partial [Amanita muscaria Koide BX008]
MNAGPSTTTITAAAQTVEGGTQTNATDLFAKDLSARLGRVVPPAEHKKAWRKLTNEQKAFWKEESKKLKVTREQRSGKQREGKTRAD